MSFGGGQVEPATGDFVFGVSEGYLIEDGEVTAPVRGATLVGNGLDALGAVDGIADDLEIDVEVVERDRRFIGFGANYSTNDGAGATAYWGHRNLFGGAEHLRLDADISGIGENTWSEINYGLSADFRKPDFLRERFPTHEPYRAWSNFEFIAEDGSINEVDLLVFTPHGFFLIEIKSRPGRLFGDAGAWTWETDGRLSTTDNPLIAANTKAKKLRALLQQPQQVLEVLDTKRHVRLLQDYTALVH